MFILGATGSVQAQENVAGSWIAAYETGGGQASRGGVFELVLKQDGETITGTVSDRTLGTGETSVTGTLTGHKLFLRTGRGGYLDASVNGDAMTGRAAGRTDGATFEFAAARRK